MTLDHFGIVEHKIANPVQIKESLPGSYQFVGYFEVFGAGILTSLIVLTIKIFSISCSSFHNRKEHEIYKKNNLLQLTKE